MKILMLIISSDTDPVYEDHRKLWRSYMKSSPYIDAYFIQYRDGELEKNEDTLWLPGKESFEGIIYKTIDSLEYFLNKDKYDFIIRTNLSSVWNFNAVLDYLSTLPSEKVYSGIIGNYKGISYVSGSGIIMTSDTCRILIENKNLAYSVGIIDDVDIGYTLAKCQIEYTVGKRVDGTMYVSNNYHYRCKLRNNPVLEIENMKQLIRVIYNV